MRYLLLLPLFATGCKDVECGEGTIERDGRCAPATLTTSAAMCGPFTELEGDRCVPQFTPTVCDPETTVATVDPDTGVTTCIGVGGGGCSAPFPCPVPADANHMTICGQLYDFETMAELAGPSAMTLSIQAYDGQQLALNPQAATPLPVGDVTIDACGRYRVVDIDTSGTSPFIGLGIDDAGMAPGPAGLTVTVGVATSRASNLVTDLEAFVVKGATVQQWATSGGPSLANGIFAALYRAHETGRDPQAGVTFAKAGTALPDDDFYFQAALATNTTLDPAATVTAANGTALVANRALTEGLVFDGIGGLGTGCRWEPHAAVSLPGIVFVQVFRKVDLDAMPGSCAD